MVECKHITIHNRLRSTHYRKFPFLNYADPLTSLNVKCVYCIRAGKLNIKLFFRNIFPESNYKIIVPRKFYLYFLFPGITKLFSIVHLYSQDIYRECQQISDITLENYT